MAKQIGTFKIKGTIGDLTFYKQDGQHLVRSKGGVDGERIKNDPAFQRTRENGSEFGEAGKQGKLLRVAFRNMVDRAADSKVTSRLTGKMMEVVKSDSTNTRGARKVSAGNLDLLKNFEFNNRSNLSSTLFTPLLVSIDKAAGTVDVTAAIVPLTDIAVPNGATHYKLLSGAGLIDFENAVSEVDVQESAPQVIDNSLQNISLSQSITAASPLPLFVMIGLEFYQEVNGTMYLLKNGGYNCLQVYDIAI